MRRKTDNYIALAAVCVLTLSACTASDVLPVSESNQQDKTLIELTAGITGENPSATRSVVTTDNPYGSLALAFNKGTSLYMVMKSEDGVGTGSPRYSRTIGNATTKVDDNNTKVEFGTGYERYYEDSYSRNSKISVYSACVPGNSTTALSIDGSPTYTYTGTSHWTDSPSATVTKIGWPLGEASVADQSATGFIENQDLCFSNNVSKYGESPSETDNRIYFNTTTNKFTSSDNMRLVFHHALTKVTFKISRSSGFGTGSDVFKFTNSGENIVLNDFNTSGTFNIADGEFGTPVKNQIKKLANTKTTESVDYVLTCLMLPGTDLNGTDKDDLNKVSFTIDGNLYHVTKADLKNSLDGKKLSDGTTLALEEVDVSGTKAFKMRPGVHYIFKLTLGKKAVDKLTAAVVPWEEVTAVEQNPSNAHITVNLLTDKGDKVETDNTLPYDFYRKASSSDDYAWETGYSDKGQLTETATNGTYKAENATDPYTQWYWPDNNTYYHFRAVAPNNVTESPLTDTNGDYITISGGSTDYLWGAPFKKIDNTEKLTYSTSSGFDNTGTDSHQIYKAIGATNDHINLTMFHMMSQVEIQLATSVGANAVTLIDESNSENKKYATLSFRNIKKEGRINMGNGLVTATGSTTTINGTIDNTNKWTYFFVPQSLDESSAEVELTITTPDGNEYKVKMKDVVASAFTPTNVIVPTYTGNKINYWYPCYKYVYTFTLTKTGIEKITATLVNWETVIAGDDNVQIQ